jgi:hypothetical protein
MRVISCHRLLNWMVIFPHPSLADSLINRNRTNSKTTFSKIEEVGSRTFPTVPSSTETSTLHNGDLPIVRTEQSAVTEGVQKPYAIGTDPITWKTVV